MAEGKPSEAAPTEGTNFLTGQAGQATTPGTTSTAGPGETGAQPTATAGTAPGAPATGPGGEASPSPAEGEAPAAAEGEKAAEAAPAELTISLPEGVEADAGLMEGFTATAKELGLTSESAQKLVDTYAKASVAAQQRAEEAFAARQQEWQQAVKADPKIGGEQLTANLGRANAALGKFGSPELVALLQQTGLSNHPEMVKFAIRVGRAMGDDTVTGSHARGAGGEQSEEDALKARYPSMFKR
jgi:hypothetical protein